MRSNGCSVLGLACAATAARQHEHPNSLLNEVILDLLQTKEIVSP